MLLRHPQPGHSSGSSDCCRLNLLLSCADWRPSSPVEQLPRLLEPMGIRSYVVESGDDAADLIREHPIHIALVDLDIPLHRRSQQSNETIPERSQPAGPRVLQMLRRLDTPPPTVVIRSAQPTRRESSRTLSAALREGAFAVLDRPLHIERMLEVMRRVLRRHYRDCWPTN